MKNDDIPTLVSEAVRDIDPGAEIFLFGSRARIQARADSDWDFLVLSDKINTREERRRFHAHLLELELATGEVFSFLINTPDDWERKREWPIYEEVKKDSVSL